MNATLAPNKQHGSEVPGDAGSHASAASVGRTGLIRPAKIYRNPGDLCVILCLFNLGQSQEKLRNFALCHSLLRISGIPTIVVDCAFGDDPWVLDPSSVVVRLRTSSVLWQKERLINVGLERVPDRYPKLA